MLKTQTLNKNTSLPVDRLVFWGRNFKMTPISKYSVAHERRNMGTSNDIHTLGSPNLRSTTKTTRLKNSWSKPPVVLVSQTLTAMTLLITTPAKVLTFLQHFIGKNPHTKRIPQLHLVNVFTEVSGLRTVHATALSPT